jgi:hypothetical protein
MVRVGGGWDTFGNYLNKHDPCRECKNQRIVGKHRKRETRDNETLDLAIFYVMGYDSLLEKRVIQLFKNPFGVLERALAALRGSSGFFRPQKPLKVLANLKNH